MSYRKEFGRDFDIGFNLNKAPIYLVDRSYHNDICPSFYFESDGNFYLLWTYGDDDYRESEEDKRYMVTPAKNEGDDQYLELAQDGGSIFQTDSPEVLFEFLKAMAGKSGQSFQ